MIVLAGVWFTLAVCCLLTEVVLVVLKLTGVIDWSWWWLWSPLTALTALVAGAWVLVTLVRMTVMGVEIGLEEAERGAQKRAQRRH